MDLVNEQDIFFAEVRKKSRQIPGSLNGRSGCNPQTDAKFIGDNSGQRRFSKTGRSMKQHMVQRFATSQRRLNEDRQILLYLILTDIFHKATGPETELPGISLLLRAGNYAFLFHVYLPPISRNTARIRACAVISAPDSWRSRGRISPC